MNIATVSCLLRYGVLGSLSFALVTGCGGDVIPIVDNNADGGAQTRDDAEGAADVHQVTPADAGSEAAADACPPGEQLYYASPGCGSNAVATCQPPPPPCVDSFCTCKGVTVTSCGVASEPFSHAGACAGDAGIDGSGTVIPISACAPSTHCEREGDSCCFENPVNGGCLVPAYCQTYGGQSRCLAGPSNRPDPFAPTGHAGQVCTVDNTCDPGLTCVAFSGAAYPLCFHCGD